MKTQIHCRKTIVATVLTLCITNVIFLYPSWSVINGPCSECHTMHNSQNNDPMTYNLSTTPNETLLKGTCYGCHAQGGASATVSLGTDTIPQVLHTGANDLAGGNFAYITGVKGPGADDRGHNISDLTGTDSVLYGPPGVYAATHASLGVLTTNTLACAGRTGCHGYRYPASPLVDGIWSSHHNNVDGQVDVADKPGNSYRFLMSIKGLESGDWEENPSSTNHNEYYGRTTPIQISGCDKAANGCHGDVAGVTTMDGTMSQFCGTCHGYFHTLGAQGVGTAAVSPFIRHPTDLALPASGEYAAYTTYNVNAPVARTTGVPATPVGAVTPGADAVMCLSCHRAHATNYPDMLRWDYTTIVAGEGIGNTSGCFVCHSTKN